MKSAQDLRYGVRALAQRPTFTAVAILTVAIGIGATTAVFSVVDAVLVKPLPFPDAARLVVAWEANPTLGLPFMNVAPPNFADWRGRSRSFEALGVWRERRYAISVAGQVETAYGADVSRELFELLRVRPVAGRLFTADEDRPGGPKVALISHGLWRRAFGGDPATVGRTVRVDGEGRQIVGIMPEAFRFPLPVAFEGVPAPRVNDVWTPLAIDYAGGQRGAHYLLALGRLRPGVDVPSAERELAGVAAQLAAEHPETNAGWTARLVPFSRQVTGDQRPALVALSLAVGMVLLLACANVASLVLAHRSGRTREIAIRFALGATKLRIARQLFTESLLLASAGGVVGLLLAAWLMRTIRALAGPMLPRLGDATLDLRALLFTVVACTLAAVLFGMIPAEQMSRGGTDSLKERGGSSRTGRLQSVLVVVELAIAVVLLTGAALLGESFFRLVSVDPGFRAERALTAHVSLPAARYPDRASRAAFVERALERLATSPGIITAAAVDALPLADDRQGTGFLIEGEAARPEIDAANVNFAFVSAGYFDALGIPLMRGRVFDSRDRLDSAATVIVNQAFADRFFAGQDPIGRQLRMGFNTNAPRSIVGIVGNERHVALDQAAPPGVFVSYLQFPAAARLTLVARTAGDPTALAGQLRERMKELDPELALYEVRSLEQIVSDSVSLPRFSAVLLGVFSVAALLLAGIGVYGVISQLVSQRTREFGVRMALGATPRDVGRLVLRFGARLASLGVLVGIPAALLFARVLSGLLFGMTTSRPAVYGAVACTLTIVALAASAIPAWRATRVDPLVALRAD